MNDLIIIRGGGDIATGTICRLFNCGFKVIILETSKPSSIRRKVSFSEAIYDGECTVEDVRCKYATNVSQAYKLIENNIIPIMIDESCKILNVVKPFVLIDAILAKKNLGTNINMAPITIGLGPGFTAGLDVHAVIETMRGHDLGRIIYKGSAMKNTGTPGIIEGYGKERVLYSPSNGKIKNKCEIGNIVHEGQLIASIEDINVYASFTGILRGIIHDGYNVTKGLKIADIDPRINQYNNCFTISDKARCISGSVVEAICKLENLKFTKYQWRQML